MFSRKNNYIKNSNNSPEIFIEGLDYQNSTLLKFIDEFKDWKYQLVDKYERRVDLISKYLYGDESYAWMILYMNKIKNDDIIRGIKLRYIPLDTLTNFIAKI